MQNAPSNKPRAEIFALAGRQIAENGGPSLARVFFKWTCGTCGSRERVPEPGVLPERGTCGVCNKQTTILGAGFALEVRRDVTVNWANPGKTLIVRKRYASDGGDA